jgi:hypothetical protein
MRVEGRQGLKKVEVVWFYGNEDVMLLVELVMDGIEGMEGSGRNLIIGLSE